jgi:hypothetical protein
MAMTAPSLRVRQTDHAHTHWFPTLRMLVVGLLVLAGSVLTGCGSGGDEAAAPVASASLSWDPVDGVQGYYVYYGTESQGSFGSCSYPNKVFTPAPSATVTGLTPDTTYYFAVSAFNGVESECSAELASGSGDVDIVIG